jgi:Fic family protein
LTEADSLEAKRRYRERCREKKKQKREREEKEIKEIRTEREVWKYINRERKKKEPVSEKITIQEWEEYFMKLLEGRKEEGKGGNTKEREADGDGGNRNHSGRGGKTHKTLEKEKGTGMGRGAK